MKLTRASSEFSIKAVLEVINKHAGLISEKTFNQARKCIYYIIAEDDTPVGVIGYRELNPWCVEQLNTVILPKHRNKGYGTRASSILTNALLKKYGKVFCTVNTNNDVMTRIKEKQGFIKEGLLVDHFGPGRNVFLFSRLREQKEKVDVQVLDSSSD